MLDHGSDVVYVPMFFDRRETFKRPCQLLIVNEPEPGKYEFDWTHVTSRFVDMCKEIGFKEFEWSHLWIYWGVENPMRLYKKDGDEYVMLWPPDTSGVLRHVSSTSSSSSCPSSTTFLAGREGCWKARTSTSPTSPATASTSRTTSGRGRSSGTSPPG